MAKNSLAAKDALAVRGPGKSESRVVIGKCDNVTPNTIEKVLHRVESSTLAGSAGFISFGLSAFGTLFPLNSLTFRSQLYWPTAHLIRCIGNDPPDGSRFWTA